MNVNLYVIEDYENKTAFRPKKTNTNKANFFKVQNMVLWQVVLGTDSLMQSKYHNARIWPIVRKKVQISIECHAFAT